MTNSDHLKTAIDGFLEDLADRIVVKLTRHAERISKPVIRQTTSKPVETETSHLLTKQQAAKQLQVTIRTVDRYRKELGLKWVEMGPGLIRFRPGDIEEFVTKCVSQNIQQGPVNT
ncbi:hypothetical protein [Lacunimicrobium album]